ncbi:hypothetical protein [Corynebacterium auris]|uniref:hypothetical protein n=1 Tax=Corynebacterium auris TaxID=44750 RepID=UPI0025B62976|nr:hypothetical protein [Corynebacterium auris]WJY68369.1 hypothetical protein CAURIS_07370 [Corynebacterium auris]
MAPLITQFTPRLAHRAGTAAPFGHPTFAKSTASITLSPGLACVLAPADDPSGPPATHQQIGAAGLTVHQAWNAAAAHLRRAAGAGGGDTLEFWVRDARVALGAAAPPGLEVRGEAAPWCAHPQLFAPLHSHFTEVLRPARGLLYVSRDCRDLFVFDAADADVGRLQGLPGVPRAAVFARYSLGFPLAIAPGAAPPEKPGKARLTRVA